MLVAEIDADIKNCVRQYLTCFGNQFSFEFDKEENAEFLNNEEVQK